MFELLFFRGKDIVDLERLLAVRPELDRAYVRRWVIGEVRGAGIVDAVVVCSAAERGDRVLTSDPGDLEPLSELVRGVRVVGL